MFPGRPVVRSGLNFGQDGKDNNSKHSQKNYKKSETHLTRIFTFQCVCQYSKVIGISIMLEMEGVSTSLSSLLSRFKHLPRVCYYDNVCNMLKSVILNVPWVNNKCLIVCDRFHYKSHTCSSVCDPDSYISCSEQATSRAESVNHLWAFSKSHLRFLKPSNGMPFMAARAVLINVRARIRERTRKSDINPKMLLKHLQDTLLCSLQRSQ